jgi:hypothetical protein
LLPHELAGELGVLGRHTLYLGFTQFLLCLLGLCYLVKELCPLGLDSLVGQLKLPRELAASLLLTLKSLLSLLLLSSEIF